MPNPNELSNGSLITLGNKGGSMQVAWDGKQNLTVTYTDLLGEKTIISHDLSKGPLKFGREASNIPTATLSRQAGTFQLGSDGKLTYEAASGTGNVPTVVNPLPADQAPPAANLRTPKDQMQAQILAKAQAGLPKPEELSGLKLAGDPTEALSYRLDLLTGDEAKTPLARVSDGKKEYFIKPVTPEEAAMHLKAQGVGLGDGAIIKYAGAREISVEQLSPEMQAYYRELGASKLLLVEKVPFSRSAVGPLIGNDDPVAHAAAVKESLGGKPITAAEQKQVMAELKILADNGVIHGDLPANISFQRDAKGKLHIHVIDPWPEKARGNPVRDAKDLAGIFKDMQETGAAEQYTIEIPKAPPPPAPPAPPAPPVMPEPELALKLVSVPDKKGTSLLKVTDGEKEFYLKVVKADEAGMSLRAAKVDLGKDAITHVAGAQEVSATNLPKELAAQLDMSNGNKILLLEAVPNKTGLWQLQDSYNPEGVKASIKDALKGKPITIAEQAKIMQEWEALKKAGVVHNDLGSNVGFERDASGKLKMHVWDFDPATFTSENLDMAHLKESFEAMQKAGSAQTLDEAHRAAIKDLSPEMRNQVVSPDAMRAIEKSRKMGAALSPEMDKVYQNTLKLRNAMQTGDTAGIDQALGRTKPAAPVKEILPTIGGGGPTKAELTKALWDHIHVNEKEIPKSLNPQERAELIKGIKERFIDALHNDARPEMAEYIMNRAIEGTYEAHISLKAEVTDTYNQNHQYNKYEGRAMGLANSNETYNALDVLDSKGNLRTNPDGSLKFGDKFNRQVVHETAHVPDLAMGNQISLDNNYKIARSHDRLQGNILKDIQERLAKKTPGKGLALTPDDMKILEQQYQEHVANISNKQANGGDNKTFLWGIA